MCIECNFSDVIKIEVTRMFSRLFQNEFMGAVDIIEEQFISSCIVDNTSLMKETFSE